MPTGDIAKIDLASGIKHKHLIAYLFNEGKIMSRQNHDTRPMQNVIHLCFGLIEESRISRSDPFVKEKNIGLKTSGDGED